MADRGAAERLPSSNRGVKRSGSQQTELSRAVSAPSRTWAGIDWLAGSVDLGELLDESGWWGRGQCLDGSDASMASLEPLSAYLAAFGPRPKPKAGADENGEVVTGERVPFVPPCSIVRSIASAAFRYLFEGSGLVLSVDAGPGSFYAYKFLLTNVHGDFAGSIELGGMLTIRKGGRPSLRFELTGQGCSLYEHRGDASADHAQRWCALRAQLERVGTMLTRVDTAFDDFDGKRSLAHARCMWEVGEFDYTFGGERHRPQAKEFNDCGSRKGSTFYVGNSTSEKQLRVYQKGRQLGDPDSPWVRWELQFKSSSRKRITLDVLSDPMSFMRGAFECLDFIASCMARFEVQDEVSKATAKSVMRHGKRMFGRTWGAIFRLAPDPESLFLVMQAMSDDRPPNWQKTGRLTWADVPGLIPSPDTDEEAQQ
ncbi:replication initiation factor domain-containing protein [Luteimonas fraxinea]|uniref:Replication initiation factor domain-containing protein n=1 Tax=Luteimonas fraxinea TaxID=2901869 RepID=A0ABS8UAK5_9GAMM|nr:replication initiation factor domain-containing protein [Luteimonas fraxinea]MCD9096531.1 replication initiation factor domain-containing protein [Luteimonas fraxinea]